MKHGIQMFNDLNYLDKIGQTAKLLSEASEEQAAVEAEPRFAAFGDEKGVVVLSHAFASSTL